MDEEFVFNEHEWSRQTLGTQALNCRLSRPRSLAWAVLLEALPSPNYDVINRLRQHRDKYEKLSAQYTTDPRTVPGDDPLSQKDESVWKQHFCDNELKALIMQDVVRTFPDDAYFRSKDIQDLMVRVLFVWARSHPLGYRQGMHEVLAPLLYEIHSDIAHLRNYRLSEKYKGILDPAYMEHDSHMLFSAVMRGLECFYRTGDDNTALSTSDNTHSASEVVRYLHRVREELLLPLDRELAEHLHSINIAPELFGIRWLRLLFSREFSRDELPSLWGFLFAEGPSLSLVPHLVVATLVAMRDTLLDQSVGNVLSSLMRPSGVSASYVVRLCLHLRQPLLYQRPATPPSQHYGDRARDGPSGDLRLEERGVVVPAAQQEACIAEGRDVASELATLALLRARLPAAAAALAEALPRPDDRVAVPLSHILQLSALLQCRNHALVDVETALEAAEGQPPVQTGRRQLVPLVTRERRTGANREVQLKVFRQAECGSNGGLPSMDPLGLRD